MKKQKAGLYTPYLDVLGGGEKYALSILKVFEDHGLEINIFWNKDLTQNIIERFNLRFNNLQFRPNIFKERTSVVKKLSILKDFDIFLYVTDGSYFISTAKKNLIYAMVPKKELYRLDIKNKIKLKDWQFITHSKFTQKTLTRWGIKSKVLYPYLNDDFINLDSHKFNKEKIILTVGRFFTHLHAKKHDEIIELFKKNKKRLSGFKLILAGGLKKEDQEYFNALRNLAGSDPAIIFKPNLSFKELLALYKKSLVYWHFSGFGLDEKKNPELVEHFGITPLEAMAAGCMTFVYNAGGPKEIIKDGVNGFLFNTEKELVDKTKEAIAVESLRNTIRASSKEFIKNHFSYDIFKRQVEEIFGL